MKIKSHMVARTNFMHTMRIKNAQLEDNLPLDL